MNTEKIVVPAQNFLGPDRVRKFVSNFGIKMSADNHVHREHFRRICEMAMGQGRWNGFMAEIS